MRKDLDLMEYISDSTAQAAYVSNDTVKQVIVSYSEINQNTQNNLYHGNRSSYGCAETLGIAQTITSIKFYLRKVGSPTANCYAKIFASTGTVGTNAKPTGAALATSNALASSTFTTSFALYEFTFATPYSISAGDVCFSFYFDGVYGGGDYVQIGIDTTSITDPGNAFQDDGTGTDTGWVVFTGEIPCYYVYGNPNLQSYSESTIKTQGSYSLKAIANKVDAFDTYTKFLGHFNGTDGQTSYTAETGQIISFLGNAQLDTAQKEYGVSSLLLPGNKGDYISLLDSDDWYFDTGDFTIDFWVRFNDVTTDEFLYWQCDTSVTNKFTWLRADLRTGSKVLKFGVDNAGTWAADYEVSWSPSINTWYHIAVVRNTSNLYIFINGISQTLTVWTAIGSNSLPNWNSNLYLGCYYMIATGDYGYTLNGWFDEYRISKGIARWTSNFTPPTAEYSKTTGGSLNKTFTRTVSPTIDLTGIAQIKFDIYSSRIGSNIKIGLHDSGGTITEITPNIISANTWQEVKINLQNVTNANKDVIDQIIITVVNADADNTFYIDNMFSYYISQAIAIG
jgi:hypothetical protein